MRKFLLSVCTACCALVANAQTDWAGTYTVVTKEPFFYTETAESYGVTLEEKFEVVIEKQDDGYVVTKFMGYDLTQSVDNVIPIEQDASKEAVCHIPTKRHMLTCEYYERTEVLDEGLETQRDTLITGYKGIVLCGNNLSNDPIKVTRQSDGQIKMSTFVLGYKNEKGSIAPLGWYDKNVPENGGDPDEEVVPYAWAGTYLVQTMGVYPMVEDVDCPTNFLMTIEEDMWDPGSFLVTEFWGHDDLAMTNIFTGGLPLTLDAENGDVSYLPVAPGQNLLAIRPDNASYYALTDGFGLGTENIQLTHNADDTFTLNMFSINTYGYAEDFIPETIAIYFGGTAKKGDREALQAELDELNAANGIVTVSEAADGTCEYFDLEGHRLDSPKKGICLIRTKFANGKSVVNKVVVK